MDRQDIERQTRRWVDDLVWTATQSPGDGP